MYRNINYKIRYFVLFLYIFFLYLLQFNPSFIIGRFFKLDYKILFIARVKLIAEFSAFIIFIKLRNKFIKIK